MTRRIYNADFRDLSWRNHYKMIFADPPDNIGLKYEGYTDTQNRFRYRQLLVDTFACINHCDILWVSFNPNHMSLVGSILDLDGFSRQCDLDVRWFVQHVTFGYCMQTDFSRCFRPMIRSLVWPGVVAGRWN